MDGTQNLILSVDKHYTKIPLQPEILSWEEEIRGKWDSEIGSWIIDQADLELTVAWTGLELMQQSCLSLLGTNLPCPAQEEILERLIARNYLYYKEWKAYLS